MIRKVSIFLLILFLIAIAGLTVFLLLKVQKLESEVAGLTERIEKSEKRLSDLFAEIKRQGRKVSFPTELEAREKLPEVWAASDLNSDIKSLKRAAESLPKDWETGILVVHYYNEEGWPEEVNPEAAYFLIIKTEGGLLYVTWGVQDIYVMKSFTEIKNYLQVASGRSTEYIEIWRNTELWKRKDIWNDNFWKVQENFDSILKEVSNNT